jgi:hypothetical protein
MGLPHGLNDFLLLYTLQYDIYIYIFAFDGENLNNYNNTYKNFSASI